MFIKGSGLVFKKGRKKNKKMQVCLSAVYWCDTVLSVSQVTAVFCINVLPIRKICSKRR